MLGQGPFVTHCLPSEPGSPPSFTGHLNQLMPWLGFSVTLPANRALLPVQQVPLSSPTSSFTSGSLPVSLFKHLASLFGAWEISHSPNEVPCREEWFLASSGQPFSQSVLVQIIAVIVSGLVS